MGISCGIRGMRDPETELVFWSRRSWYFDQVVKVRRKSDSFMSIKLVVGVSFATLKSLEREAAHLVRDALIPHHE